MHLAAAHHAEAFAAGGIFYLQRHVFQQLFVQTVTNLTAGDKFTLFACKRAVVNGKGHFHCRVVNLHKGKRLYQLRRTQRIADVNIRQAAERHNITCAGLVDRSASIGCKAVQCRNAAFHAQLFVMPVAHRHFLSYFNRTILYTANTNAAHKLVVVYRGAQHCQRRCGIAFGRLDVINNGLKERLQILARHIGAVTCCTRASRAENHRAVQLFVCCAKIHEQQQNFVDDLFNACVRTVNFIYRNDQRKVLLQRFLQNKARLRHTALSRIHEQQHAVDHFQHTFHFAAKVGVARGINNINFYTVIIRCGILCQNRDTAFTLDITGVHDTFCHLLIFAERTGLLQHLVYQGSFAVVNVRNNGNIS